jgi:diguanylate cyclase (GGDEF)-like protein
MSPHQQVATTYLEPPAQHDASTGLAGLAYVNDLVCRAIDRASRSNRMMALATIDIDTARAEQSLGRTLTDELLECVSHAVTTAVHARDAALRVGTGEFLVIVSELADAADTAAPVQRILDAIASPLSVAGKDLRITVSAGIAIYPIDGDGFEALRCKASAAIHAGNGSPGRIQFYSPQVPKFTPRQLYLRDVESPAIIALLAVLAMGSLLSIVWWLVG